MCCNINMITKLELTVFVLFHFVVSSVLTQNCDQFPALSSSSDYRCLDKIPDQKCTTYAILRANSHYSSLSNLTSFLSIPRAALLEANAFSNDVDFLPQDHPILIPIECKCSSDGFSTAEVRKISIKGESFHEIAESLEGLTTCSAINAKNPSIPPWNLPEGSNVVAPVKCACPTADARNFLVTYPVKEGDTLSELAAKFNVSQETLVSANAKYSSLGFRPDGGNLVPISTLVIPLQEKPVFGFLEEESIRVRKPHKRRRRRKKMWMIGVYVAMGIVGLAACAGVGAAFFFLNVKRKKEEEEYPSKNIGADVELQQLSLSIRTTSDKKVSFEGSQYNLEAATPHKMGAESYALEDLDKATEGFSSTNLISGSVFHGRFKGKNLAIKRVSSCDINYDMINGSIHRHPNIMRLLGTCLTDASDSFIVFEYAMNGSLKDWIHGGLAIKSHFIASCSCFLTWNQRLKICLDAATALQHMHHIINPAYIHGNVRSRNIFLDEDFTAKLGSFGFAKLAKDEESDGGYLAPECLSQGTTSTATDVFAYGVVLLEALSGKPPVARDEEGEGTRAVKLSDEIKRILQSEDAEELRGWMDGALGENYCFDAAVMLANLARSCVEEEASLRPNAGEIVEKLLRLVEELPEKDELSMCESSCRPLVSTAAKGM